MQFLVAFRRKYESIQRLFKEEEKENYQEICMVKAKIKYRQRRRRVWYQSTNTT